MPEVKRQTAYKCSIKMILDGTYVQRPGWDPNYIQINNLQISRINILAVIVNKEGSIFTIDDATGQIQVMTFGEPVKFEKINIGDVVQLIGRPREYNGKRFVVPEIMKVIEDSRWIDYRKLELAVQEYSYPSTAGQQQITGLKKEEEINENESENSASENNSQDEKKYEDNYAMKIISSIRKLDKGDGASVNDVIKACGLDKAEKYIISLINEGEIFEIKTGRIKILE